MSKGGWNIHTRSNPMYMGYDLYMINDGYVVNGERIGGQHYVNKLEMAPVTRHGRLGQSDHQVIPHEDVENFLQSCMDAAWAIGLRPTGFKDHTDELTAVRYHLEDMRFLVNPAGNKHKDNGNG